MFRCKLTGAVAALLVLSMAQAARGQGDDARFRADIEKLLDVTGVSTLGAQMANLVSNQMIDGLMKTQPTAKIPDRAVAVIKETLSSEFAKGFVAPDGLRGRLVAIYAKHFTHAEVTALLNFYATDVGRKTLETLPKLTQEGSAAGQEWATANMPRISDLIKERLRAEGLMK